MPKEKAKPKVLFDFCQVGRVIFPEVVQKVISLFPIITFLLCSSGRLKWTFGENVTPIPDIFRCKSNIVAAMLEKKIVKHQLPLCASSTYYVNTAPALLAAERWAWLFQNTTSGGGLER